MSDVDLSALRMDETAPKPPRRPLGPRVAVAALILRSTLREALSTPSPRVLERTAFFAATGLCEILRIGGSGVRGKPQSGAHD